MLSKKSGEERVKKVLSLIIVGLLLSVPAVFLSVTTTLPNFFVDTSFVQALWNLRAIDVVSQALVMMTIAIGITIILYERKEGKS